MDVVRRNAQHSVCSSSEAAVSSGGGGTGQTSYLSQVELLRAEGEGEGEGPPGPTSLLE